MNSAMKQQKYNRLAIIIYWMDKLSQTYLNKIINDPIKSPSPDFRANRIVRTKNIINTASQFQSTPTKNLKFNLYEQSTSHKNKSYESEGIRVPIDNQHSYCHDMSYEINEQIKKLLSLISASRSVSQFYHNGNQGSSPSKQTIFSQVMKIQNQNNKLLGLLKELQERPVACPHVNQNAELHHEIYKLKDQLAKITSQCDAQLQTIYQNNQSLNSQLLSVQDRNSYLEKQVICLQQMLRQRQDNQWIRGDQSRRKSSQLSISMIKQQYSDSIKAFKYNLSAQVENIEHENEYKIKEMLSQINILEQRLRGAENQIKEKQKNNRRDGQANKTRQNHRSEIDSMNQTIMKLEGKILTLINQKQDAQSKLQVLTYQQEELIAQQNSETQVKIKKLMESYELSISILQKQNSALQSSNQAIQRDLATLRLEYEETKTDKQKEIHELKIQSNFQSDVTYLENQNLARKKIIDELSDQVRDLQTKEQDLIKQLHLAKTQMVALSDYNMLKSKNGELSGELSSALFEVTSIRTQNHGLICQHEQLSNELESIKKSYNLVKEEQISKQMEIQDKDKTISELSINVNKTSKLLEKMQQKVNALEENKAELQNNEQLKEKISVLQNEILEEKAGRQAEINQLRVLLYNQIKEEIQKEAFIKIKDSRQYSQSLKDQLKALKVLVGEAKFQQLEIEIHNISQLYNQQLLNSEIIRQQNERLLRLKTEDDSRRLQLEKLNLAMQEKSRILESDNKLLESELKKRKQMYQQILSQKSIIQKQISLLKQVKVDKQSIEATKIKAREITMKIDRLLGLQEERESVQIIKSEVKTIY